MFFTILYFAGMLGGFYYLYAYLLISPYIIIPIALCTFLAGMQWGEFVEKIQTVWRVWRKVEGGAPH